MRYALVNAEGLVENAIVYDGEAEYTPPEGLTLVKIPDGSRASRGWTFDGTTWTAPPPPPDPE